MFATSTVPVLIAGSGPTGLVLALALSINGIGVRLIDREVTHRVGSKGAGIQPRAMEMYRFLGVLKAIQEMSSDIMPMRKYQADGCKVEKQWDFVESWESTPDYPYGDMLMLGQDTLEQVLREALEQRFGVVVELGTELVKFELSSENVTVHLKKHIKDQAIPSDEAVFAEYLVGADGGRSVVRKMLGLDFVGETRSNDTIIYGDLEISGLDKGVWHMFGEMSTKAALFRTPDDATPNRWAVLTFGKDIKNPGRLGHDHEAFEQHVREVTNRDDIKITRYHYLTAHQLNVRMCHTFSKGGRAFIAGDAAHIHSATGAQGINSSVQDSFNLGWKLASVLKGLSSPKLLETYTEERVPVIEEMLERTTALLDGALKEEVSAWTRPRILQQLGIHYEWSSIVYDDRVEGGRAPAPVGAYGGGDTHEVRAGDRAPEAPALEVMNTPSTIKGTTTLFDIYNPSKHTVLLFVKSLDILDAFFTVVRQQPPGLTQTVLVLEKCTDAPYSEALDGADIVVVDVEGHAFKSYGVTDNVCATVVRPDGVVGAMVGGADGLAHYFGLIFDARK